MALILIAMFELLVSMAGVGAALYFLKGLACIVGTCVALVAFGASLQWLQQMMDLYAKSAKDR